MNNIKVSIIILCFNVEKFIEKGINSAINQTLKEIEIIAIDDGSTDNTINILRKYSHLDKRIKIISKPNSGVSSTRNLGIISSKGEYIQFLDGDDYLELDTCEKTYNFAKKNNLDIVCYNICREIFDRKFDMNILKNMKAEKIYSGLKILGFLHKNQIDITNVAKLIRRELFIKNKITYYNDISLGEDLFVFLKLALFSLKVSKLDKSFYHYILNENSITNTNKSKRIFDIFIGFDYFESEHKNFKENKDIKKIKSLFLSSYLYTYPIQDDVISKKGVERFLEYVKKDLKFKEIFSLDFKRKILYSLIKIFPNKKALLFISKSIKILKSSKIKTY